VINWIHSKLHHPSTGWDPVPIEYAKQYMNAERVDDSLLDRIESRIGGFSGKRVLDLGGGPGRYTVAMARRGAEVTWHDVSTFYRSVVAERLEEQNLTATLSLGYLEEAKKFVHRPFDFVINSICWNYSMRDRPFARLLYRLVAPGGSAYIDSMTITLPQPDLPPRRRFYAWMYHHTRFKVGHPYPPMYRTGRLFTRFPLKYLELDYTTGSNDRIFLTKW
jgi:2-polyprenyl-3-methyl-5-hydroxy-6-metoxy-1,4-benzoquinol methylase